MARRVLIISSKIEFNAYLEQALEEASEGCELETLDRYPTLEQIRQIVEHNAPLAVLIGFAQPDPALSTVRRFRRLAAGLRLIAVHHEADPVIDRAALRAGAEEFFAPPINVEGLKSRVFGAGPVRESFHEPGSLYAFVPARGGDGSSTLALHIAQALSTAGGAQNTESNATLFVDFDFHAGASAFRLKLDRGPSVIDALKLGAALGQRWRGLPTRWRGLDLLVAPESEPAPSSEVFERLPELVEFLRNSYRHIVVDMPPALYASSRDLLRLTDRVFIVQTPEVVSRAHADRRADDIFSLGLDPARVVSILNRADSKTPQSDRGAHMGRGLRQFATVRNDYASVTDAELGGRLVAEGTGLGQDIRGLAEKIIALG